MSRLFITPREIHFINDITKEYMKDVVGQKILYFPISALKTKIKPPYDEAIKKAFDNPIIVFATIAQPEWETKQDKFGIEQKATVELFVHGRDLIDKGFSPVDGDYFKYGGTMWEIMSVINTNNIFGLDDYDVGFKLTARNARANQFYFTEKSEYDKDDKFFQQSGEQKIFEQQRGLPETTTGIPTADFRQMRDRLGDDMADVALGEGPMRVDNEDQTPDDNKEKATSFNNESINKRRNIYR